MREKVREGHELISRIAPHWQVRAEVPHLVPLLHLQQGERALNVLLRVDILPACGRARQLVAVALLRVALLRGELSLRLRLRLGLGGRALGSLALGLHARAALPETTAATLTTRAPFFAFLGPP
jgi:hypothetical protein